MRLNIANAWTVVDGQGNEVDTYTSRDEARELKRTLKAAGDADVVIVRRGFRVQSLRSGTVVR